MNLTAHGLDPEQLSVLAQAGRWLADQEFYLAGGTALAIYFSHRRSVDLDWFTAAAISDPLVFAQRLRDTGLAFETGQTAPGTLYGRIGNVRVSFIEFRYPFLQPLVTWPANGIALASMDDLACMKLSAIAQRGSRKDFYDVHRRWCMNAKWRETYNLVLCGPKRKHAHAGRNYTVLGTGRNTTVRWYNAVH